MKSLNLKAALLAAALVVGNMAHADPESVSHALAGLTTGVGTTAAVLFLPQAISNSTWSDMSEFSRMTAQCMYLASIVTAFCSKDIASKIAKPKDKNGKKTIKLFDAIGTGLVVGMFDYAHQRSMYRPSYANFIFSTIGATVIKLIINSLEFTPNPNQNDDRTV